jgi:hypothetical protein
MTLRRTVGVTLAAVLLIGAAAWAALAADGSEERPARVPLISGISRATRYYPTGPSADYEFDNGNIGVVPAMVVALPAGSFDVVITVSLDHRTSRGDRAIVAMSVRRDEEFGPRERVAPTERPLPRSSVSATTTTSFRLKDVAGGHDYWISPTVNISLRDGNRASIATRNVLVVVDAVPSA